MWRLATLPGLANLGVEAHAKALALTKGVEWELLDQVGRKKMVSTAMREPGTEAHAKALARTRGVEWESLDHSGRAEIM